MAPQIEPLSTSFQAMTQDDYLALCLRILSQRPPIKTEKHSGNHLKFRFKCSICGKAFSSYHALGGHKSSHRRPVDPAQMIPANINVNTDLIDNEGLPHRCNVCYKSFATGQALGGHKRCHYLDGYLTSGSNTSASTLSSVRDFDLNLPPKKEYGVHGWGEEEEVSSPMPVKKQPRLI
ncbi:Zinc finger protein 1 [Rhynchospora pubera]|uniref:Zinc finger protein 1 n=1 Tax=Rhynchospora pubera TaxID=906938 RepID=A0AAV8D7Q8_9POAL|nr:Zinc finger protein 1 [Rhynchospora pubera]